MNPPPGSALAQSDGAQLWQIDILEESSGASGVRSCHQRQPSRNPGILRPVGPDQGRYPAVLMRRALHILRQDLPATACPSPHRRCPRWVKSRSLRVISGIRAMGLRLETSLWN